MASQGRERSTVMRTTAVVTWRMPMKTLSWLVASSAKALAPAISYTCVTSLRSGLVGLSLRA